MSPLPKLLKPRHAALKLVAGQELADLCPVWGFPAGRARGSLALHRKQGLEQGSTALLSRKVPVDRGELEIRLELPPSHEIRSHTMRLSGSGHQG